MPHSIRIKRSSQPGGIPQNLLPGELAYNLVDRLLYIGGPNGEIHQVAAGEVVAASVPESPLPTPLTDGFTTNGIRRRLLPFEG
jgi:hypothetical protein